MSLRRAVLLSVLVGVSACSRTPDRPAAAAAPTAPSAIALAADAFKTPAVGPVPGSLLTAPVPPAGKMDAVFPGRNLSNDFFQRLIAKYRDGLRRSATPLFIDNEGMVVWIQEYYRYIANGCDNATSIQRVFAQIDGNPAGALCNPPPSNTLVAFPPRDQAFAFALLLNTKYQQMARALSPSFVDLEGAIIWLQEYLRYYTNGCDHETSIANTLTQIDGNPAPRVCFVPTCKYTASENPKSVPGGGGTFTLLMFRREGECDWTAKSQSSFIKLQTTSGSFSGPLTFTVDPSTGGQARRGSILVEWTGGSEEVVVDQGGGAANLPVNVQLFQGSEVTECDIAAPSVQCTLKAVPAGAQIYSFQVAYEKGGVLKKFSQTGGSDTFVLTESCGGTGTSPEGVVAELVVTLTVTDTSGNAVTIVTGQGAVPSKFFRFRTCS